MTNVAEFVMGVLGRAVGAVLSTYIVRFLDKFLHKNNRHE